MKLKSFTLVILACVFAVTACSNDQVYWKRADGNATASLPPAQADALLNKNITACTAAVEGMNKDRVSQADSTDFDDCMQGAGWKREGMAPPDPQWLKADSHQYVPPQQPQAAKTYDDKRQIATDMRHDALVPQGGQTILGFQGFQDHFHEKALDTSIHTNYYGGVAGYTHRNSEHNFWTVDGRFARGLESYSSPVGVMDDVPQYEAEIRYTVGHDYSYDEEDSWLSPYAGLGSRLFLNKGKGHETNLGVFDYDRRIAQLYVPLGATLRTLLPGQVTMANTFEVDPLLIGHLNYRYQNAGGPNSVNTQDLLGGFGLRAESMFGIPLENATLEMGPFVRYWNINVSSVDVQACGGGVCSGYAEPYNTRLQIGVTSRVSF